MKVKISDLKTNLFVRTGLNEDRVMALALLIEAGTELTPIEITRDMVVIDGRHRIEAHGLAKKTEIQAKVVDVRDENDLIARAYRANLGGSLPPTQQDTEHTITLLLERNVTLKSIGDLLGLPANVARHYVNNVKSRLARAKLQRAMAAVAEGFLNVNKAAETHGVDPDKLREAITGRQKKANKQGVPEMQRNLTKAFKSLSSRNAALLRSVLEKYEDGDLTEKQVRSIFEHLEGLQKKGGRAVADWRKRFEGMLNPGKTTT